jgi:IS4 transposase
MLKSIITSTSLYIKQILSFSGFRITDLKSGVQKQLLTAFQDISNHDVIMIPEFVNMAKKMSGDLILDDTSNPKYGLKKIAIKFKNLSTGGYHKGYKILLFLWDTGYFRIPIGFALCHKGSGPINKLARKGLSLLRNTYELRPETVLADGAFLTDETAKLITDYGWAMVMRFNKARKLSNTPIRKLIPRGYGEVTGTLKNGTKLKVIRRKNRFYTCNRMLRSMKDILKLYVSRWKIEEIFRVLKSCIGLNRCQQHSLESQAIYVFMCLVLFTYAEQVKTESIYKELQKNYFKELDVKNWLANKVLVTC